MRKEKSCGAVVYTKINGEIKYIIIQSLSKIYGFLKGHVEGYETEMETALREIKEETGLEVELAPNFRISDSYLLPSNRRIKRQIIYFLGSYQNQKLTIQKSELLGANLYTYEEALKLFQFDSSKKILTEANNYILKNR